MKTLTKEEILDKICKENMSNVHNMKPTKEMVLQAMQSYSDQENVRLTAINKKQAEYLAYLKRAIHSESIIDNITAGARDIFESELSTLKDQSIDPESDIPKHPTSWRDFTMTEKIENEVESCIHFDSCQGRNKCLASQVISDKCIGVNCGFREGKRDSEYVQDVELKTKGK